MSSVRHVQVGGRWEPPPPASGLDPDSCPSLDEWRSVLCQLAEAAPADRRPTFVQAAVRGFRGVSPQLARDLAAAAGVPADAPPAALSPEQWARLHERWQGWLAALHSGSFTPSCCPTSGAYSLLGTQAQGVPAVLPFLHAYYTAPQSADQVGALKQQLTRAVASAISRLQVGALRGACPAAAASVCCWCTGKGQPGCAVGVDLQEARFCPAVPRGAALPATRRCAARLAPHACALRSQPRDRAPGLPALPPRLPASPQKKVESLQRQGGEGDKHAQTQRLADMVMANVYRCGEAGTRGWPRYGAAKAKG